jgi:hypothetical protein
MVSSKSLTSNTKAPVGEAKAPRLLMWASPQICTVMPVVESEDRSAAIIGTAPRKKPNGEAMRAHLMGNSSDSRSRLECTNRSTGSGLVFGGFQRH